MFGVMCRWIEEINFMIVCRTVASGNKEVFLLNIVHYHTVPVMSAVGHHKADTLPLRERAARYRALSEDHLR